MNNIKLNTIEEAVEEPNTDIIESTATEEGKDE